MKSVWLRIDGVPDDYFGGYGYPTGEGVVDSTLEDMGAHIAEGIGHSEGISGITWWADVDVAATVIHMDGVTECTDWQPDHVDLAWMSRAGIVDMTPGESDITPDEGGLFTVTLGYLTAMIIATGGTPPHGWEDDGAPPWWDMQRGEGGIWLKLPSTMWVGIAPIDLEHLITKE